MVRAYDHGPGVAKSPSVAKWLRQIHSLHFLLFMLSLTQPEHYYQVQGIEFVSPLESCMFLVLE